MSSQVLHAIRQRQPVRLRITGTGSVDELFDAATEAEHQLIESWRSDGPQIPGTGLMLSPPTMHFGIVPPAVVVAVANIEDVEQTSIRLQQALAERLPRDAQVTLLPAPATESAPDRDGLAPLELRIAVQATPIDNVWDVEPSTAEQIDDLAARWLTSPPGPATFSLILNPTTEIPISAHEVRPALRAQRALGWRCGIAARRDGGMRAATFFYGSAHTAFITAVRTTGSQPSWLAGLAELEAIGTELEPFMQGGLIRSTTGPWDSILRTHLTRGLDRIPNRRHLTIYGERALEEDGLVDAHGVVFLPDRPTAPPGWTVRPFGRRYRLAAPDLEVWLAGPPSAATLTSGRRALARWLGGAADRAARAPVMSPATASDRQPDGDPQPRLVVMQGGRAAMGEHNLANDGQTEAGAASGARPGRV